MKGRHKMVGERTPLSTHQTGSVAQTSPGSTSLLYVETGLEGFALEFNSLLPGLDSSETGQKAFMLFLLGHNTGLRSQTCYSSSEDRLAHFSWGVCLRLRNEGSPNLAMKYQLSRGGIRD